MSGDTWILLVVLVIYGLVAIPSLLYRFFNHPGPQRVMVIKNIRRVAPEGKGTMYGKHRFVNADGIAMVDKYLTVQALRDLLATLPNEAILRPNDITRNLVIYPHEDAEMSGWIDFSDGTVTRL